MGRLLFLPFSRRKKRKSSTRNFHPRERTRTPTSSSLPSPTLSAPRERKPPLSSPSAIPRNLPFLRCRCRLVLRKNKLFLRGEGTTEESGRGRGESGRRR